MSGIDEILWLLKDGKWHSLREITEKCSSSEPKVKVAVSFLWEYDLIQVNGSGRKAKIRPLMLKFIDEVQRVERLITVIQMHANQADYDHIGWGY